MRISLWRAWNQHPAGCFSLLCVAGQPQWGSWGPLETYNRLATPGFVPEGSPVLEDPHTGHILSSSQLLGGLGGSKNVDHLRGPKTRMGNCLRIIRNSNGFHVCLLCCLLAAMTTLGVLACPSAPPPFQRGSHIEYWAGQTN